MKKRLPSKIFPAIIACLMTWPINTLHAETDNLDLSLLLNTSFSGPVSFFMLADVNPAEQIRFLEYADYLPDMYGNTLFVTRELYQSNPVETKNLPRTPSVAEVFDRSFLPDESELIKSLARE